MTPTEKQIRTILIEEPCTFDESVKRIERLIKLERQRTIYEVCKWINDNTYVDVHLGNIYHRVDVDEMREAMEKKQ